MASPSPLSEIRELFRELMGWDDETLLAVDFVMSSYLSTFMPGAIERPWGDLCAGASSGKGELLRAFDRYSQTIQKHNLTENAFSSAFRSDDEPEKDNSLLAELSPGYEEPSRGIKKGRKVLILPELTTFLSMRPDRVAKFFGDLRAAYDGEFDQTAGNLGGQSYRDLHFGLITGCTEILDEYRRTNQTLGERTLVCRIGRHLRTFAARRSASVKASFSDPHTKEKLRNQIKELTGDALDAARTRLAGEAFAIRIKRSEAERLAALANLVAGVRSFPLTSRSYVSTPEVGARLALQLRSWGNARVLFDARDTWDDSDYTMARRIAQDTSPPANLRLFRSLWAGSPQDAARPRQSSTLLHEARHSDGTRQLRQWCLIGLVENPASGLYRLPDDVIEDVVATRYMENVT